jgi:predicted N-formylglutamate amidohydrolase
LDSFVVTCEHGGNRIPRAYRRWFATWRDVLETHRGWDPGALLLAKEFAAAFAGPLVESTTSRLLVDLNRSIGNPDLFSDAVPREPPGLRTEIVTTHYFPYRERAENLVEQAVRRGHRVVHVSSHSFTPVLDGEVRTADVGLLYDPARPLEAALCARWKQVLADLAPGLRVRRNHPYLGKGDGLASHLRKRFSSAAYVGVELEVNQAIVFGPASRWKALRGHLVESLRTAANPKSISSTKREAT